MRVDQLMNFAWKILVPLALANLMITALVAKLVPAQTLLGAAAFLGVNVLLIAGIAVARYPRWKRDKREVVLVRKGAAPEARTS